MIEVAARRALIEFEEMNDEHDESKLLREWIGIERLTPPPPPHLPTFVNSLKKDDVLEARIALPPRACPSAGHVDHASSCVARPLNAVHTRHRCSTTLDGGR